jgi:uncharacterized membrane protein
MFGLPSFPTWDALHPSISHFPIALLVVSPILVILGLCLSSQRRVLMAVALGFMVAGTAGVYLAAATGDAAKELAPKTPEVTTAIESHENVGSVARAAFTVLTVLFAALLYGPAALKRELDPKAFTTLTLLFLALFLGATLVLVNTAHTGGILVHKLGVHARIV